MLGCFTMSEGSRYEGYEESGRRVHPGALPYTAAVLAVLGFGAAVGFEEPPTRDVEPTYVGYVESGTVPHKHKTHPQAHHFESGPAVSWAQRMLSFVLGREVVNDAVLGPDSQAAVREFQASVKLPQTGKLDQRTLQALELRYDEMKRR
jgi:peptidoglycan hydrolase-like protein with peptidoglycan-binding domain